MGEMTHKAVVQDGHQVGKSWRGLFTHCHVWCLFDFICCFVFWTEREIISLWFQCIQNWCFLWKNIFVTFYFIIHISSTTDKLYVEIEI